jgi:alpha-acetolactate decarboxylase
MLIQDIRHSKTHGNLGIATLTGSDGEVIFLDGKAYHANEHKEFIDCCNGNVLLALKLVIDAYGTFSSPFNSINSLCSLA